MRPSEIRLAGVPLVATAGHAEAEHALAIIIRALQFHELEMYEPISWRQIQEALKADYEARREPFCKLIENPYFNPSPAELVQRGFARWVEEGVVIELLPTVEPILARYYYPC